MQEDIVTSRVDSRDGSALHDVDVEQFLNSQNCKRLQQGEPLICDVLKITGEGPRPGFISTLLVYK